MAIGLVYLTLVATLRSLTGRTHLLWRATDRHSDAELKGGFVAAVGWDPSDEGTNWRFFRMMPVRFRATGATELEGPEVMRDSRWLT